MKSTCLIVAAAALLLPVAAAHAQIAVYANFEGAHFDTPDKFYTGGTFGLYDDFYKFGPLHLGGDIRGSKLSTDHNSATRILAGFRAFGRNINQNIFFPRLDWRVAEVGGQVAGDKADANFHVSTGIVLRFF